MLSETSQGLQNNMRGFVPMLFKERVVVTSVIDDTTVHGIPPRLVGFMPVSSIEVVTQIIGVLCELIQAFSRFLHLTVNFPFQS